MYAGQLRGTTPIHAEWIKLDVCGSNEVQKKTTEFIYPYPQQIMEKLYVSCSILVLYRDLLIWRLKGGKFIIGYIW